MKNISKYTKTVKILLFVYLFLFLYSISIALATQQAGCELWIFGETSESQINEDSEIITKSIKLLCEKENFDLFFAFFAEDTLFQLAFIKYPLKKTVAIDEFDYETNGVKVEYITTYVAESDLDNGCPVFPNSQTRLENQYFYTVNIIDREAIVTLQKEGTGISIRYLFIWDGFWFLYAINDDSI